MKYIVLDTCAILHIIRKNKTGVACLNWINSLDPQPIQVISVVTKAELLNLAVIAGWQSDKTKFLNDFLKGVVTIDILNSDQKLLECYKLIDCYSKNKLPDLTGNYKGGSHYIMGKNDIWIGATALILNGTLVTTDKDFDHLHQVILNVKKF